ncbi:MAG: nitroreductase family protein [Desulfobacterales bacterium]|jgi:nitroreductase
MFMDLITKRRSIRRFTADKVELEKIELLKEAALRAPSSRGINPWEFIFITDRDLLANLSTAKPHGSTFLKDAPLGVVVCADPQKSDVWVEDASIATIFIELAAASLDLGSCWIQIRKRMHVDTQSAEAYIANLLNIPSHLKVESMIAIGYPAESKPPHSKEELQNEKVYLNQYGEKAS